MDIALWNHDRGRVLVVTMGNTHRTQTFDDAGAVILGQVREQDSHGRLGVLHDQEGERGEQTGSHRPQTDARARGQPRPPSLHALPSPCPLSHLSYAPSLMISR